MSAVTVHRHGPTIFLYLTIGAAGTPATVTPQKGFLWQLKSLDLIHINGFPTEIQLVPIVGNLTQEIAIIASGALTGLYVNIGYLAEMAIGATTYLIQMPVTLEQLINYETQIVLKGANGAKAHIICTEIPETQQPQPTEPKLSIIERMFKGGWDF